MLKRYLHILVLLFASVMSVVTPVTAYAQALPINTTADIGKTVGQTILTKLKYMGWAANDARYIATLPAIESQVSTIALSVVGGGASAVGATATAPAWLTIAASLAIGYGVSLAIDQWYPDLPQPTALPNPQIQITQGVGSMPNIQTIQVITVPNPITTATSPIAQGDCWDVGVAGVCGIAASFNYLNSSANPSNSNGSGSIYSNVTVDSPRYYMGFKSGTTPQIIGRANVSFTHTYCSWPDVWPNCPNGMQRQESIDASQDGSLACPTGTSFPAYHVGFNAPSNCIPDPATTRTDVVTLPVDQYAAGLANQPIGNAPVNPALIASLADQAWRQAAMQPNYKGVPYQQPVSPWDVDIAFQPQNNPTQLPYPTVNDLLKPAVTTSASVSLNPAPSASTGDAAKVDLGPDPGIPQPTLEATPTAAMILAPILSLMPDLRSFAVPAHQSICPTPSMDLFGRHIVMDSHCAVTEAAKSTLQSVMAFVWVATAMFIILRA